MRLLASVLLTVFASFGIVVTGGAGPALACSCAIQQVPGAAAAADEVFAGTLVDIQNPPQKTIMSSTDPITYSVAVDSVYQGDVGSAVTFESAMSGVSCGLGGMVADRRYVFFTSLEGARRVATSCGGTSPATPKQLRTVERLLGAPTTPPAAVDAAATPGAVRSDEDGASSSGVPGWAVGVSLVGAVALVAAGLRLRRRSA